MAASARLNTGHQRRSMKSTMQRNRRMSKRFPAAPPKASPSPQSSRVFWNHWPEECKAITASSAVSQTRKSKRGLPFRPRPRGFRTSRILRNGCQEVPLRVARALTRCLLNWSRNSAAQAEAIQAITRPPGREFRRKTATRWICHFPQRRARTGGSIYTEADLQVKGVLRYRLVTYREPYPLLNDLTKASLNELSDVSDKFKRLRPFLSNVM